MSAKNSFARQKDDWTEDEGRLRPRGAEVDGGRGDGLRPEGAELDDGRGTVAPKGRGVGRGTRDEGGIYQWENLHMASKLLS
ncbi:MAG: hypothetical protein RSE64_04600, partial [Oscillospiraceae bacterium]